MIIANVRLALSGASDLVARDVRVSDGVIRAVGDLSAAQYPDDERLDGRGYWLFPGGIDPHVHFYDPGYADKEDFEHGTGFAAAGGVTTVIDMPCTSDPPVTNRDNFEHKQRAVAPKAVVDYAFHGGVSRQLMDGELAAAMGMSYEEAVQSLVGLVAGIKCYAVSGMEALWGALDSFHLQRLMSMAAQWSLPVLLHAEDAGYVNSATAAARQAGADPIHWYRSRPEMAELLSVQAAVTLARATGCDLHVVHVGTAAAAEVIAAAVAPTEPINGAAPGGETAHRRAVITAETCPHYLEFDVDDFARIGAALKIAPPVKSAANRARLWRLLAEGAIDYVASDHAPGTVAEKSGDDIWRNSAGMPGVGTLVPYLFSRGLVEKRLSLARYLEVTAERAAQRFGLWYRKGSIAVGKDADLVLINPHATTVVQGSRFFSHGKLTPFEGMRFHGRIERTMVRGKTVYQAAVDTADDGTAAVQQPVAGSAGWGRLVQPHYNAT